MNIVSKKDLKELSKMDHDLQHKRFYESYSLGQLLNYTVDLIEKNDALLAKRSPRK